MVQNPQKRPRPPYHWEGFGRKNTKPPWYDPRLFDKERRDVAWVVKDFNPPGVKTEAMQALRKGAAPFVYDNDPRIYKPTVPVSLNVEVPATPSSRTLVSRDGRGEEFGLVKKSGAMMEATRHSHLQMLANAEASRRSEVSETICGKGESIEKPLLYPQNVSHQQALNLERRAGPSLPFDKRLPRDPIDEGGDREPRKLWNQHMYLPYSRTRSDFPGLTPSNPAQTA